MPSLSLSKPPNHAQFINLSPRRAPAQNPPKKISTQDHSVSSNLPSDALFPRCCYPFEGCTLKNAEKITECQVI